MDSNLGSDLESDHNLGTRSLLFSKMAVLGGRRAFVTVKYLGSSAESPTNYLQENCCHLFSLHSSKQGLHAFLDNMLNCRISSFSQWTKLDKPMDVS